jgi:leucyl aminopeptidase
MEIRMSFPSLHASAQVEFNPAPSLARPPSAKVNAAATVPAGAGALGVPVASEGDVPKQLGVDRAALRAAGFDGKVGQTLIVPRAEGPALVAFGIGNAGELDAAKLRDAAAAFARAASRSRRVAVAFVDLPGLPGESPAAAAQAIVEGVLLARYRYLPLKRTATPEPALEELTVVRVSGPVKDLEQGLVRGGVAHRATALSRDLANAPATLLTARKLAEIAQGLAAECGLELEIFDENALAGLGCGGMLGVNAGSAEPPRLIRLAYRPRNANGEPVPPTGRIALVGKGIMYDSGGISLKPNDLIHATMKGDMSGASAVLAAMTTLKALDCKAEVTGYLMCTDNMPGGNAMKLGDVLTIRGGTTIEVMNTDAEGRLVLADGLVLATEQRPAVDAIIDIATLTGACQRALGVASAGVIGNHQAVIDQVIMAGNRSDETVWQLPLDHRYRKELDSEIADMKNVGGDNAGAITAALFLEEFVAGIPWAHIDIAGTARSETDESWRSRGATGYGARLLIDLVTSFAPPGTTVH